MVKQYLKRIPILSALISPVAKIRNRIIGSKFRLLQARFNSAVVGGEIDLHLVNIPGVFRLPAVSDITRRIIFDGFYEPESTNTLLSLCNFGGVAVNVGANVGLFSAFLAQKSLGFEKVIAIEPNPEAYRLLVHNISKNELGNRVVAINACIGETRTNVKFSLVSGKPEYSSINGIVHPAIGLNATVSTIDIPQVPLDELINQSVTFLFIDVEGAEELVFRGAEKLLRNSRPVLFFECSDILLRKFGSSSAHLDEFLTSLGYAVHNAFALKARIQHPFEGDVLALPIEVPRIRTLRA